jgi:hypothetical protein
VPVPRRGQPFPSRDGTRVGQVFLVDGRQHAVALAGGVAPVTPFQAALLLGDPATVEQVGQVRPTPLTPGEYAALPTTALPGVWDGLPVEVPRVVPPPPDRAVCVVAEPTGGRVVVGAASPRGAAVAGSLPGLANEVHLPPGRAAIITARPAPDAVDGALYLVTELGVRHLLPSVEVLAMLGYAGVVPVPVPVEVAALLPVGPALYPQAARAPVGSETRSYPQKKSGSGERHRAATNVLSSTAGYPATTDGSEVDSPCLFRRPARS